MADIKQIFVNDDGEWRQITRAFVSEGGSWNEISIAEAGRRIAAQHQKRMVLIKIVAVLVSSAALISLLARMLT